MEDINKKIEEFENKYGMCELSVDDLDNVGGGAGIGLNSQDSVGSFCEIVNVLIITQGFDAAVKFASSSPAPRFRNFCRTAALLR